MKSLLLFLLSLAFCYGAFAQCATPVVTLSGPITICPGGSVTLSAPVGNSWTRKADLGGAGRDYAAGFSIGNKGYIGTGGVPNGSPFKDFWEYDPYTDAWTQKADFGGTARYLSTSFSIGNKGYVGMGSDGVDEKKDFWEYDPSTNAWTRRADFGGVARSGATGFSIGGKGYIGTGSSRLLLKDFWEYTPSTNTWIQKADFAGPGRAFAAGFSIGNKGYIGTGAAAYTYVKDFWEYDPSTNAWIQKADFGGEIRRSAAGFSIGSKGYIGTGGTFSGFRNDFWEYDPSTNAWTQKADLGGVARWGATGFSIGGKGYMGMGSNSQSLKDFSEYNPGYTYSWSPGGQTSSSITVLNANNYTVTITNALGCSSTSASVGVTVKPATQLIGQPQNTTACPGGRATLAVTATGANLRYVWKKDGTVLSTTVPTLIISNAQPSDTGNYTVDIIGDCGTVTSNAATLTINSAPMIVAQPVNVTVCQGTDAMFSTAVGGTPAPAIQWQLSTNAGISWLNVGDNSSSVSLSNTAAAMSGVYRFRAQVSNSCGTVTSNVVALTVNTKPVLTAPANITVSSDTGCSAGVNFAATATGSPAPSIMYQIGTTPVTSPYTFPVGVTRVTAIAANACGTDSKTFTVTVEDKTPPSFTAPAARNVSLGAACSLTVPDLTTGLTVSDNCGTVTFSQSPAAGTVIPSRHNQTYTVTVTAADGHGNATPHDVMLTAKDITLPAITAPVAVKVATDAGKCSASSVALGNPFYSDNCSSVIVRNDAPAIFPKGSTTVTWTATDAAGNKATATQTVTVEDKEAPVVPDLLTITAECTATVTPTNGMDNCAGVVVPTSGDPLTYTTQGTFTIHWTYSDGAGNSTVLEQKVVVKDVTKPVPAVVTLPDAIGDCSASITTKPTATDNCAGIISGATTDPLSYTVPGNYIIHWTYDDGNGNVSTQEQRVTLNGVSKPMVIVDGPVAFCAGGSVTLTAPDGFAAYRWSNGAMTRCITVTQSGTYSVVVGTGANCGSAASDAVVVTVNQLSTPVYFSASACNSYTLPWGNTVTVSGDYTHTYTNRTGCDSIVTVHVSINGPVMGEQSVTACERYAWNGTVYTTSGDKTKLFPGGSAAGCDSTATLHLTIGHTNGSEQTVDACGSHTLPWGAAAAASGDYTHHYTNVSGCDSLVTVHLFIVVPPAAGVISYTTNSICTGTTTQFTTNGATSGSGWSSSNTAVAMVNSSGLVSGIAPGTATITYSVSNGCGSNNATALITVNALPAKPAVTPSGPLTFYTGGSVTLSAPAGFASYKWSNGAATQSITVTTSGAYTVAVTNNGGCKSIASDPVTVTVQTQPSTLTLSHLDADYGQLTNNTVRPYLQLNNEGAAPVAYKDVTIRYWLTVEDFAPMTNLVIDWAQMGREKIRLTYVKLGQPRQGAYGYLEYSFDASAGNLAGKSNSGPIQSMAAKSDWTDFNEANDYSYAPAFTYTKNSKITVYQSGSLVWGTEPAATAPLQSLKACSQDKSNGTTTNSLAPWTKLNNEGNTPVSYSDVTLRYWFTADGAQPLIYHLDYAQLGNGNVKYRFVKLPAVLPTADTYLELSFAAAADSLYPISSTGIIQQQINKSDWSNFTQLNDHSFKAGNNVSENAKLTVYVKGVLVYGTEPVNSIVTRTTATGADTTTEKTAEKSFIREPVESRLQVTLLSNPIHGNEVELLIKGAQGEGVQIEAVDVQGKTIGRQRIGQAGPAERVRLSVAGTASQFIFVKVITSKESKTIKAVKANQ